MITVTRSINHISRHIKRYYTNYIIRHTSYYRYPLHETRVPWGEGGSLKVTFYLKFNAVYYILLYPYYGFTLFIIISQF